jgi:hypothetical protein
LGEDFIALAKRPLDFFPWWKEKFHVGLNIHTSLEYWKCPCTIGTSHDYDKEDLQAICKKESSVSFDESVELLSSPYGKNWWIWEKQKNGTWEKTKVPISVIVFNASTAETLQAFFEPDSKNIPAILN